MRICCRIRTGESLWGNDTTPWAARLAPAGLSSRAIEPMVSTLFGLQSLPPPRRRRCALRLPFAHHGLAVVCCAPGWAYNKAFQPRHGFAVAREGRSPLVRLAAHGGPRRGAGSAFSWSIAFRFALQSRPSLLSRSPAAGLAGAAARRLQRATPVGKP